MTPTGQDERLCLCGHTAHWHGVADGVQGAGECEHDGECPCKQFGTMNDYTCPNGHVFAAPNAPHGGPWSTLVCSECGSTAHLELCWECAAPLAQGHTADCPWGAPA